jgi:hypothetical protein
MIEEYGIQGQFEIYVNGKLHQKIKNRIMNTVLQQMIRVYQGQNPDLEIKYLALGTSNTPITDTDTTLGNEIFRTAITEQNEVSLGTLRTEFVILDTEAVGLIKEIGLFGGSTATASANSGTLISRILWSKNKTNNEELNIIRTDKVVRA